MNDSPYVLITAACNEGAFLGETIRSVLAQTVLPLRWVLVNDASTDNTDAIVTEYARRAPFLQYVRLTESHPRSPARRIAAIRAGYRELRAMDYRYIGSVDGDVTFEPEYFETLIHLFSTFPELGIAGGVVRERRGAALPFVSGENCRAVANAAQMLRRECFEDIGGYPELPYGAPDTYVEVVARMRGWRVQTVPELVVEHHRLTGTSSGVIRGRIRQGYKDRSFGYHPLFEVLKCARRTGETPVVFGAVCRMAGYLWACLRGDRPAVSDEFVQFLRSEQMDRVHSFFGLRPPTAENAELRSKG